MKQAANSHLSPSGKLALEEYEQGFREREDLSPASIRNYLSDIRHFIAWYEQQREAQCQDDTSFTPQTIMTPTITRYRTYLQTIQQQKPTSVNRSLIRRKLCQNVSWATSSKNVPSLLSSQTSAHMICGIALAIAWLKLFHCIDWRRLLDMTQ